MKKHILNSAFICSITALFAQHTEVNEKPEMWKGKHVKTADSTSLLHAFKTGQTHGHFRYFMSSTINDGILKDYYANAIGGGIRYETNKFHNFQFAVSGFYFFNIGSSHLADPDPYSGQMNRYEIGLFDIENPDNHKDMDRLEELYLKYNLKKGKITFGRQLINTPLINLQDGRMRGTGVEGLWMDYAPNSKWKFEGGWLYAISPRSTTKWYRTSESIGIYPSGVNIDGTKSNHAHHLHSEGVGVVSAIYKPTSRFEIQAWDYLIDNILNTGLVQAKYEHPMPKNKKLILASQFIRQDAINNGGNADPTMSYTVKGAKSMTVGAKVGVKIKNVEYSINYNHITKDGRYLFPREWGRDPFFTFMPRERNEGFGNVHAINAKIEYKKPTSKLKYTLAAGYYQLPDVKEVALNKYGLPSYYQINVDVRYNMDRFIQGMDAQLLLVTKLKHGETYNMPKYEINKVNMMLINFVLNYHF